MGSVGIKGVESKLGPESREKKEAVVGGCGERLGKEWGSGCD